MHASSTRPARTRRHTKLVTCHQTPRRPQRINEAALEMVVVLIAGEWALAWQRRDDAAPAPPRCTRR